MSHLLVRFRRLLVRTPDAVGGPCLAAWPAAACAASTSGLTILRMERVVVTVAVIASSFGFSGSFDFVVESLLVLRFSLLAALLALVRCRVCGCFLAGGGWATTSSDDDSSSSELSAAWNETLLG